jgi:uncharacterized membrane protein required for colicin V production
MAIFDVVLLLVWSGFVFYGLFFGFIRMVGNFVGLLVGAYFASHLYLSVFEIVGEIFNGYDAPGKIAIFLFLFGIFSKLTSIGVVIVEKIFNIIAIIPFLKTFNRLLGAILGLLVGGLTIGLILYLSSKYFILESLVGNLLATSQIAPALIIFGKILSPLLPETIKAMKSLVLAA